MHAIRTRLPKHFVLEERLERYADAIEVRPQSYAGRWREACHPLREGQDGPHAYQGLWLDLGCGKGGFTADMAECDPTTLFVGVDFEPVCMAYAAEKAVRRHLHNMVLVPRSADRLSDAFAPGELDGIYLNFPTPFPRRKEAHLRLTHADRLLEYRRLLAPDARLLLKTDSYPLWRFSLDQLDLAGYDVLWQSEDARAERSDDVMSWYERRLSAQGATVYAVEATPQTTPIPACVGQRGSMSLVDYLPADLDAMAATYVPHGMRGTVTNLRNQRLRAATHGQPHADARPARDLRHDIHLPPQGG